MRAKTGAGADSALGIWEGISPKLDAALAKAARAGVPADAIKDSRANLDYIRDKVLRPGAYWEEKYRTMREGVVTAPDLASQKEPLQHAEEAFKKAKDCTTRRASSWARPQPSTARRRPRATRSSRRR